MSATPGLAVERTTLAWQRTALSLLGVSLLLARLAYERLGPAVLVVVAVSLAHVVGLLRGLRHRQHARLGTSTSRRPPMAVGTHAALLSLQVTLLAAVVVAAALAG
ncbi:DUF202 domain-containing protein [Dermatophilaceae bacterium Soc4.6]